MEGTHLFQVHARNAASQGWDRQGGLTGLPWKDKKERTEPVVGNMAAGNYGGIRSPSSVDI